MPKKYGIIDLIPYAPIVANKVIGKELGSYKQAMNNSDKSKWLAAM